MHVLVLPSWYPTREHPGRGTFCQTQVQALEKQGARVGVVHPETRSLRQFRPSLLRRNHFQARFYREEGRPTLRLHGWNVFGRLPWSLSLWVGAARRLVRRYIERVARPDVIHAHCAINAGIAAAAIQQEFGIPYVLTEHYRGYVREDKLFDWQWAPARRAFNEAHRVLAVSASLKEALIEKKLTPPQQVRVVPNVIDTDFFARPLTPRLRSPFRVLYVGRLVKDKNVSRLLDAFHGAFAGDDRAAELVLVGGGAERSRLEQRAQRLGIAERVSFRGEVPPERVRAAMQRAHVLVLPSKLETFGVVLVEAMATGLPVITTARGIPGGLVTPESGRRLHTPGRAALAEALRDVRAHRAKYDPALVREHTLPYGLEQIGARIAAHLHEAIPSKTS